jgi:hypothetical protein
MEDHVVAAEIAVDQRGRVVVRNGRGQPGDQRIHVRVAPGEFVFQVLPAPAPDLPREIVAGPAIIGEAHRRRIDGMERGDHAVHLVEIGSAIGLGHFTKGGVPEHPAFHQFHHVERAADHRVIVAHPRMRATGTWLPASACCTRASRSTSCAPLITVPGGLRRRT